MALVPGMFAIVEPSPRRPPQGPTLIRSATLIADTARWEGGLKYVPEACGDQNLAVASGYCGSTFAGFPSPLLSPLQAEVDYLPPYVAVGQACSTVGGAQVIDEVRDRARRLLELSQTSGIARELWRGDKAQAEPTDLPNDYFTKSPTDVGNGQTYSVLKSWSRMEQALATCSVQGGNTIHVAPRLVPYLQNLRLVERLPDGRLITGLGTIVIADPGYDGSNGADGPDLSGTTTWIFGTGPIDLRLGTIETLDDPGQVRTKNDFTVYAYRPFAATFDPCCKLSAKVDLNTLT